MITYKLKSLIELEKSLNVWSGTKPLEGMNINISEITLELVKGHIISSILNSGYFLIPVENLFTEQADKYITNLAGSILDEMNDKLRYSLADLHRTELQFIVDKVR